MYYNVFGEKVSKRRFKEMCVAAKNRRELIAAGLTSRRDLLRMGLLTAGGMLVAKSGLSARAQISPQSPTTGLPGSNVKTNQPPSSASTNSPGTNQNCVPGNQTASPKTRAFIQPLPIIPLARTVASLSPTPTDVPLMIAAALVAKDPEKYGFTGIEYQEPLRYEKVKVPELTDLSYIAKACEISVEEIKDLNPELRRGVTPPNEPEYEIKIPFAKKDLFTTNFDALQPLEKFQFKTHLVKNGETLKGIARLYRVDLDPLLEINTLKKASQLSKGMTLFIPISKDEEINPPVVAQKKNGKARSGKPQK